MFLVILRRISKSMTPIATMVIVAISPYFVRKVNSKNSRENGIAKAASMIKKTVNKSAVRSLLSGREMR